MISAIKIKAFKENELIFIETRLVRGLGLAKKQTCQKLRDLFIAFLLISAVQFKFQVMSLL